jgi:short-subunit dehydrogenase
LPPGEEPNFSSPAHRPIKLQQHGSGKGARTQAWTASGTRNTKEHGYATSPLASDRAPAAHTGQVIIRDSVILVTGASSGLGRATAEVLALRGGCVLVHGRDMTSLTDLASRIGGSPIAADLSQPQAATQIAKEAIAFAGHVDVLVANAGAGWSGPFIDMAESDIDAMAEVNLMSAVRLTHALLPGMLERNRGYLAFVTSIAGRTGVAGESVYAAAKAGLDAFAESLRLELRGTGVGVGVLVPGVLDTSFFERRGRPYARQSPKPLPPHRVAGRLARMIERGDTEVYRPAWLRVPVALRGVAPTAYRALARRFGGS